MRQETCAASPRIIFAGRLTGCRGSFLSLARCMIQIKRSEPFVRFAQASCLGTRASTPSTSPAGTGSLK